jgi:hypothetical protein
MGVNRDSLFWTPRTQEHTGGFNPREVLDHDINPNQDRDGLGHHGRETDEDGQSRDQQDPNKRRKRAMAELRAKIPHVSVKPTKIDDVLARSPQFEQEQRMLEAGVGMSLDRNGVGLASGRNAGSVRSEGPNVKYGMSNTLVPGMLGKAIKDGVCTGCGKTTFMPDSPKSCVLCQMGIRTKGTVTGTRFKPFDEVDTNSKGGYDEEWQQKNTSEDIFEQSWDDISKAKRKYKGRKYSDDEEDAEEERKAKAKSKRKKKRSKKKGKLAVGGRDPKSRTKRKSASDQIQLDRGAKVQAFHPNKYSDAIKRIGSARSEQIPLRLRDPIAWERKKAYERMRRAAGPLPRGLTHHADTRGVGKLGGTIGGLKGSSTKMPSIPRAARGTSTARFKPTGRGIDPLGVHDPLLAKAKPNITRSELMNMKRKIESLLAKLNKLTKSNPDLGIEGKVGSAVSGNESSAPTGATKTNEEDKAYRFVDMALANEMGLVGKK